MNSRIDTPNPDQALLDLLLRQSIVSAKASMAAALAAFAVFAQYRLSTALVMWTLTVLAVSGSRALLLNRRARRIDSSDSTQTCRLHYWTGLASAASWGALAMLPADGLPAIMHSLTWIVPIVIATTAMSSYSIVIAHYRDYLAVLVLCVLGGLFLQHGEDALAGSVVYALFGPVIYLTGRRYHHNLVEAHQAKNQAQSMLKELSATNQSLRDRHAVAIQEEQIARHVFEQLILTSESDHIGIHTWNQAMGSLSGDLVQVRQGSQGRIYILLGDFTGHGLPAALGAVPTATVFRAMVDKNLPLTEIVRELNRKLYHLLPTGYFCCAAVLVLSHDRSSLEIWNGGLPPLFIREGGSGQLTQIAADHLPLGVVDDHDFDDTTSHWSLRPRDTVYVYSDGLTEAENVDGEMWGRQRFLDFLTRRDLHSPRIEHLKEQVLEFTNLAPPSDDISVVEIQSLPRESRQDAA